MVTVAVFLLVGFFVAVASVMCIDFKCFYRSEQYNMSCFVTKPTKWHVHPAKTQISLGIRLVRSVFAVRWWKLGPLATQWVHKEDWSDWVDAQADLSLCWAHMPFCWCCHEAAHYAFVGGIVHWWACMGKAWQTVAKLSTNFRVLPDSIISYYHFLADRNNAQRILFSEVLYLRKDGQTCTHFIKLGLHFRKNVYGVKGFFSTPVKVFLQLIIMNMLSPILCDRSSW